MLKIRCNNNILQIGGPYMKNIIWELFSKTGNIETYLLLKEIEGTNPLENVVDYSDPSEQEIETEGNLKSF